MRAAFRRKLLREVRDSHFIIDEVEDLEGEEHLSVLVRFVDLSHTLGEEHVGFLPYKAAAAFWL